MSSARTLACVLSMPLFLCPYTRCGEGERETQGNPTRFGAFFFFDPSWRIAAAVWCCFEMERPLAVPLPYIPMVSVKLLPPDGVGAPTFRRFASNLGRLSTPSPRAFLSAAAASAFQPGGSDWARSAAGAASTCLPARNVPCKQLVLRVQLAIKLTSLPLVGPRPADCVGARRGRGA